MLSFFKKLVDNSGNAQQLQNLLASDEQSSINKQLIEENYMYSTSLINSLEVEELSYDEYMQIDKLYQKN